MNIKTGVILAISFISLFGQSLLIPYAGSIEYSDSEKDFGWFAGVYFQKNSLNDRIELALERTEIDYSDDSNSSDLKQNDVTAVFTHYMNENSLMRFGGHYIDSSEKETNAGFVAIFGVKYFEGYDFDMGIDAYFSYYGNYTFETKTPSFSRGVIGSSVSSTKGMALIQIEPSIGFTFGEYSEVLGSFYTKLYYDYIQPDTKEGIFLDESYHSIGFLLKNFNGRWTNEIGAWFGKQVFAVRNGGFTVFNLTEEHQGGFHASANYSLTDTTGVRMIFAHERFKELERTAASSNIISASINYRF